MELARQIRAYGETQPGLEQYAIQQFATAFHTLPKALAENAGVKSNEVSDVIRSSIIKLLLVFHEKNVRLFISVVLRVSGSWFCNMTKHCCRVFITACFIVFSLRTGDLQAAGST